MEKGVLRYLRKQQFNSELIDEPVADNLELIVIIPAFNEPTIIDTLNSLLHCTKPEHACEIIILINDSEATSPIIKKQNESSYFEIQNWIKANSSEKLTFHCVHVKNLAKKHAGAGLARKLAMDEAIRRFHKIKNYKGVIVSLDADTLVSPNYLKEIQKSFKKNEKQNCTIFQFEHQITSDLPDEQKRAIILYELYLRYFKQALKFTGFPYAYHTIGSCFAVRADAYIKQGGMNRRQGGEDFYFLHKIFPLRNTTEITEITVYPSSRISDRVPFGTGPALKKIINDGDYLTYNPTYFTYIKYLFNNSHKLYNASDSAIGEFYKMLHESIKNFINLAEFTNHIKEINNNSSSPDAFINRFYNWFDAFKIIKYLNFAHNTEPRLSVTKAIKLFLTLNKVNSTIKNDLDLLKIMRHRDKTASFI